jgi:hypothetical protein
MVDAGKRTGVLGVSAALLLLVALTGCAKAPAPVPAPTAVSEDASQSVVSTASLVTTSPSIDATPIVDSAGAEIGTTLTVGSATTRPVVGGIPRPTNQTVITEGRKLLLRSHDVLQIDEISVRSVTQDKKGTWWALVDVKDKLAGENQAVLTFDGKRWIISVFGQGITDDDIPPDVRF